MQASEYKNREKEKYRPPWHRKQGNGKRKEQVQQAPCFVRTPSRDVIHVYSRTLVAILAPWNTVIPIGCTEVPQGGINNTSLGPSISMRENQLHFWCLHFSWPVGQVAFEDTDNEQSIQKGEKACILSYLFSFQQLLSDYNSGLKLFAVHTFQNIDKYAYLLSTSPHPF